MTYFLLRLNYVIYLFDVVTFLILLELHWILVRSNYVQKLHYKIVICLFLTKKWRKITSLLRNLLAGFEDVFKTCSRLYPGVMQRCLRDTLKMYNQVKLFFLTCLRNVFKTFLRHTGKKIIYRRICLVHTPEKFMVSVQNLQEWSNFLKF